MEFSRKCPSEPSSATQDLFVLRTDVLGGSLQAGDKARHQGSRSCFFRTCNGEGLVNI
jgi:hypothetical protein